MEASIELLSYVVSGLAIFVLLGLYVSWRATRLDRLHGRVEAARAALDAALVRRAAAALELAASGLLDPATSLLLAGAAHEARAAGEDRRELAESDLSRALRAAFGQPDFRARLADRDGGALVEELDAAATKVLLARRFYNDAVAATRTSRRRWLVRALRLAGHAAMPAFFEIDDVPPDNGPDADTA
ncbi:MAG: hypothetical protein GEV03_12475 [Streptosporangiales bacterium]|nr:hypothetical protein [Streptosporangiales bacterium]